MDVTVGFDGKAAPQSWTPVLVELFNDGPPVEGLIELRTPQPSRSIVYSKPVVLPTNSRKRLWLYPYAGNYGSEYELALVTPNGRIVAENIVPYNTVTPKTVLVASAIRSELNLLAISPQSDQANPIVATRARHVALPDEWIGYQGLHALVLSDPTESEWTAGQRQALRNWVALGGHLVVSIQNADNFIKSSLWEELLPLRVTGSEVVSDLDALAASNARGDSTSPPKQLETPVAVGEVVRGNVLARSGDKPLVVQASFGRGKITLLTFSIEREPFRSWTERKWFWRGLFELPRLESRNPQFQNTPQWGYGTLDDIFRGLLEAHLERQISLWWLLLLIGCYLVVIGPFDYWFVCHKLKKPVLTWVTFPCYVVGFSALIYGIGYTLKSGDSELLQVSLIDVVPEANLTRGTTIAGFYSTSNRRYEFHGPTAESHFRFPLSGFDNPGSPTLFGGETQVIETDGGFITRVPVPIWSSKSLVSEWTSADKPLAVGAKRKGDGLELKITNLLATKLVEVHAFEGNQVHILKELAPNETIVTALPKHERENFDTWRQQQGSSKWGQIQLWGYPSYRHNKKELPSWSGMLALMTFAEKISPSQEYDYGKFSTWPGVDLSSALDRGEIVILAYTDALPTPGLQPQFSPDKIEHHALIRCVLKP